MASVNQFVGIWGMDRWSPPQSHTRSWLFLSINTRYRMLWSVWRIWSHGFPICKGNCRIIRSNGVYLAGPDSKGFN